MVEPLKPADIWWWVFPTLAVAGSIVGGLLGSFFSKRGEIAAIQSQIERVVDQNKRLVESSEAIKNDLADKSFSKQRHWDIKRDTALEIMRMQGKLSELAGRMAEEMDNLSKAESNKDSELMKISLTNFKLWQEMAKPVLTDLWQLEELARLAFSQNIYKQIAALRHSLDELMAAILMRVEGGQRDALFHEFKTKKSDIAKTIWHELEM